jgi:hypothetical protein
MGLLISSIEIFPLFQRPALKIEGGTDTQTHLFSSRLTQYMASTLIIRTRYQDFSNESGQPSAVCKVCKKTVEVMDQQVTFAGIMKLQKLIK